MKFLLLLLCSFFLISGSTSAQHVFALDDDFDASAPEAPIVTADNLLDAGRFWPYHTTLTEDFQPSADASRALKAGLTGTLIRVAENGSEAIVDFGRDGLQCVPAAKLDLVSRAEAIRTGKGEKRAENLVLRIGGRLVDGGAESLRPFIYDHAKDYRAWVVLFAEPDSVAFKEMHAFFAELTPQDETIFPMLFPLGAKEDDLVLEILRKNEWGLPFVYHFLTASYLKSMRPEGLEGPAVVLYSPEGRLLFTKPWSQQVGFELVQKIEAIRDR